MLINKASDYEVYDRARWCRAALEYISLFLLDGETNFLGLDTKRARYDINSIIHNDSSVEENIGKIVMIENLLNNVLNKVK